MGSIGSYPNRLEMSKTKNVGNQKGKTMFAIFLSLAIVILTLYHHRKKLTSSSTSKHLRPLPPSPWRLPWIGNLHQLGSLPHRSLARLSQIHGPLMLLRLGSVPTLVVSSPEAAKEVLKTQDLIFASRPLMAMTKRLVYGARDVIFAPYGEGWRQAKKLCIVHMLCSKRVQSYTQVIEDEVATMLHKVANESRLGPINLSMILNDLASTIITRIVVGNQSNRKSNEFRALVEEMSALIGLFPLEDFFPELGWLAIAAGITSRARTCFHNFDKLLDGVIDDRRLNKHDDDVDANEKKHEDLVDLLLSMQRDHEGGISPAEDLIKPIILDLVAAGSDTSFVTLEWSMSELLRNPQLLAKAKEETHRSVSKENTMISDGEAASMEYVHAVVKETLRLHPPAPLLLPRESTAEATVLGYMIPSRARVMVNAWAIGRDPKYWEEPEEFRPERFIDSRVDYRGQDFHFLPFGSGRRMCPGVSLAMATVRAALANLINMFDWEIDGGGEMDMGEALAISARRKVPLVVLAKPCFENLKGT